MSHPEIDRADIDRMMKEAELYESQGLYDHAVLVYQTILTREPENRKAQAKMVQVQLTQKMEETTISRSSTNEDLSPRLAMDLGVAYMGMSLYSEALEEFKKALRFSPVFRSDLLRYSVVCLIHLERYKDARKIADRLLADDSLTLGEKGDIVQELLDLYVEERLVHLARGLLERLPEEIRPFTPDYDEIVQKLSDASGGVKLEIEVEDTETGEVYKQPVEPESEPGPGRDEDQTMPLADPSIPLETRVSYSLDNKTWLEGRSSKLAANWALLDVPGRIEAGDSLVVRIHLETGESESTISVVSKVEEASPPGTKGGHGRVKVSFLSFLPGAQATLKTFLDNVAGNPSLLTAAAERARPAEESPRDRFAEVFSVLEEQAVRSMETELLQEFPKDVLIAGDDQQAKRPNKDAQPSAPVRPGGDGLPRIRFACECGQVHVVPARNAGRKGKCGNCGKVMTVPVVDARPDSLADLVIGRIVGGCRLLYKIGGGGMGGVFKGHHIALDISVAIKILHAHLAEKDPVFIKRFIREARAAAKLQHPNVVGVMNVGLENGLHFLVMPFVGGGSAAALLTKLGRLPVDRVLRIATDITRALQVAEENNMLHRDIKPANILFTVKGDATLADLGLAKNYLEAQDSGITQTGIACGTPLYFSPEQAKGSRDLDIRSDIYSFGITLYHLLNGSPPFKGESAYVIFQKHVHEPLPPFDDFTPPVPAPVSELIQKMTAKNPDNRCANSQELLVALEDLKKTLSLLEAGPEVRRPRKSLLERLGIWKSS